MAETVQSGNLLDPATWGGVLPGSTETSIISTGHDCTLTDGQVLETGQLTILGTITTSGNCELTGRIVGANGSVNSITVSSGHLISSGDRVTTSINNPGVVYIPAGSQFTANALIAAETNTGGYRMAVSEGTTIILGGVTSGTGPGLTVNDGVTTVYGQVRHSWSGQAVLITGGTCNLLGGINVPVNAQSGYGITVNGGTVNIEGAVSSSSNNSSTARTMTVNGGIVNLNLTSATININNVSVKPHSIRVSAGTVNLSCQNMSASRGAILVYQSGGILNINSINTSNYTNGGLTFYLDGGETRWLNSNNNLSSDSHINGTIDGGTLDLSGVNFTTEGSFVFRKNSGTVLTDADTNFREVGDGQIVLYQMGINLDIPASGETVLHPLYATGRK